MLEQKYFFSASTDNKWPEFAFDRWKADLLLLVLQHVVTWYSAMETSIGSKDGGKRAFQPFTSKEGPGADTPRGKASKLCPELSYDHALVLNDATIEDDLNNYAKRIYPLV